MERFSITQLASTPLCGVSGNGMLIACCKFSASKRKRETVLINTDVLRSDTASTERFSITQNDEDSGIGDGGWTQGTVM
jgi:hypothetical protein